MFIPVSKIIEIISKPITGVLHVGAHLCEEKSSYNSCGILDSDIYWVEANPRTIFSAKKKYPESKIYEGCIDISDDIERTFYITNNGQSSSLLEFGTHSKLHPWVKVVDKINVKTTRLDTLISRNKIPMDMVNFVNLDIQGVELNALKSMEVYLPKIDCINTEVNFEYVYKDCCLIDEIDKYLEKFGFRRHTTVMFKEGTWGDSLYIKS